MITHCIRLTEFLHVERSIIQKHIDRHMWFQQIPDANLAIADFNDKYGWLMRELFCGHMCEMRARCALAAQFLGEESRQQAS